MNIPKQWIHIGTNRINVNKIQPIQNDPVIPKPIGGLWASPLQLEASYYSEWQEYSEYVFGKNKNEKAVIFNFKRNAKIYMIDNQKDLIQLITEVGIAENPFPFLNSKGINFEMAKNKYDDIYLTSKGQIETRYHFQNEYNLNGWDCESCIIMNLNVIGNQMSVVIK